MTLPKTKAELIEMGRRLSDLRHAKGFHHNRTFEEMTASGRAWSEFEAACRDWPNKADVAEARQAQIDRMWWWHAVYEYFARQWLARHPLPWLKSEAL